VEAAPQEPFFQGLLEMFRARQGRRTPSLVGYRQYLDTEIRGWPARSSEIDECLGMLLMHNQTADYRAACKETLERGCK
jgi:hypothetical protein